MDVIRIKIIPFGRIPQSILEIIKKALSSTFNLLVEILREERLPTDTFNRFRNQYRSDLLLKFLEKNFRGRVFGVTKEDLYTEGLNFVFGQAKLKGRVAILSIARLDPKFFHQPENERLFEERVEKEAIHEIGHMLGLTHCDTRGCVMNFSNTIGDVDKKTKFLCNSCKSQLGL